ncbi:MAG: hydrogenase maturation protease, partial [Candidatus Limnocylindrales bacterium]
CVVVDAVVGIPAGQVVVLELDELGGPAGAGMRSTHLLPPAETIALAGALGADLRGSRLVGIGGADFTFGADLSPAVEAGLPRLVRALGRTILELAAHRPVEAATLAVLVPGPAFVNPPQTTDPRKESQP